MITVTHVLVMIAAVIAGVLVGDVIDEPVKRIAGRWWRSARRLRGARRRDNKHHRVRSPRVRRRLQPPLPSEAGVTDQAPTRLRPREPPTARPRLPGYPRAPERRHGPAVSQEGASFTRAVLERAMR